MKKYIPPLSSLVIFTSITLIFVILVLTGHVEPMEYGVYDRMMRFRGPRKADKRIVIVTLDQASANELNKKKGGWGRAQMAKAIANLTKAGAEVIGLDMIFSAPDRDPQQDLVLAKAIEDSENVVLAKYQDTESDKMVVPLPVFQAGMVGDGAINLPSQDDVIRRLPFLFTPKTDKGRELHVAFAIDIVRCFHYLDYEPDISSTSFFKMGKGRGQLVIPLPNILINYAGPAGSFSRIPFYKAVNNMLPANELKGAICLIGSTLATDQDFYLTPYFREIEDEEDALLQKTFKNRSLLKTRRMMPGVEIHANIIQNILEEKYIEDKQSLRVLFFCVALFFSLFFYIKNTRLTVLAVLLAVGIALSLGIGYNLFTHKMIWVPVATPLLTLICHFVGGTGAQVLAARLAKRRIAGIFGRYVSKNVADHLIDDPSFSVDGKSEVITVLFSDIRGFTTLSESLTPEAVGKLLNEYFSRMLGILFDNDGTLDKLMGDAVMAFFGAPVLMADHAKRAAKTALLMGKALDAFRKEVDLPGAEHMDIGIGLNTGPAIVGNLGAPAFVDYTVIGDTVNTGSRLEGMNKMYGTHILCGPETAEAIQDDFVIRNVDAVRVKGKHEPVEIFEIMSDNETPAPEWLPEFKKGVALYRSCKIDKALKVFEPLESHDPVSQLYAKRCRDLMSHLPEGDWDYVYTATSK